MRYFKLTIAYDGTDFHGWQIQANKSTIQGEIVHVLELAAPTPVSTPWGRLRVSAPRPRFQRTNFSAP